MKLVVTGGCGFIGSALVLRLVGSTGHTVLNLDALTYAGNTDSLAALDGHPRHLLRRLDLRDRAAVDEAIRDFRPDGIIHLAAESHVDRSIEGSRDFIETNVLGTHHLLEAARHHLAGLPKEQRDAFRFLHVSTDEVYGELGESDPAFTEGTPYDPRSPYAASKAASDHLARAWANTYGLPVLVTHCSNNYGPRQFPEKLVPHMILNAISGKPLPVYGDGRQVRDWLHVEDHVDALLAVFERGRVGATYNIGGNHEMRNIDLVHALCALLDEIAPERRAPGLAGYANLVTFVTDRPGHDRRYAIDTSRITAEIGWSPSRRFAAGLRETVEWYLAHPGWWQRILSGEYRLERRGITS